MTEYGKKVGNALKAVRALHSDSSRLLQECDGQIGGGKQSLYGNYATRDLTYNVRADQWMAEGVYRFYDAKDREVGLVEGVTVCFTGEQSDFDEPILLVGQLKYVEKDIPVKTVADEWDLWYAYFNWNDRRSFDEIIAPTSPATDRIEWIKLIAVPLYSVQDIKCVVTLMNRVRQHSSLHP